MRVYGFVGEKRGKSSSVEQILRLLNGRLPQPAVNALLIGKRDGLTGNDARNANLALCMTLRMFLGAWIDSGKTEGEENASKRTLTSWRNVLQDYLERNPPMVELSEQGPHLFMFPHVWDERKELSAFAKNAVNTSLSQMNETPAEEVRSLRRIMPFVWDTAIALVLLLLDSPERTRLFRCDGCQTYFMRARAPKKNVPIYRGSWCENCKGKGSARRTETSRDARTKKMVERAADVWANWKQDRRHGERSEWVAEQVNKKLPANANHIAKNWVTRHQDEIEAEVERREHAKG